MEIKSRVQQRHAWGLETSCGMIPGEDRNWPTLVRDLSHGGVGLVLERRIEPDSDLAIEVPQADSNPADILRVRVIHATAIPGGQWLHGCVLVSPLSEDEIQRLLGAKR